MFKSDIIEKAVEVAKEAARGGNAAPHAILENVYNKITEIAKREGIDLQD